MSAKDSILVTVGVPTLNREEVLAETLQMVLKQSYKNLEVIVADQSENHSPDFIARIKAIGATDKRLRYFSVKPKSLPAARNFITAKARGSLVLFLDDDVVLKPDFVTRHVALHQSNPEYRIIVGRIMQSRLPLSKLPLYFDKYGLPQGTFNSHAETEATMINGANVSIDKAALKSIGGFCTAYTKSAIREESDAGYRLTKAGHQIYYSGGTSLVHLSAASGGTRIHKPQFDDLNFYVNDLLFMLRTVKFRYLPMSLFKRLRIYSGGSGLLSLRRFKRACIFTIGLIGALYRLVFARHNFASKEVGRL